MCTDFLIHTENDKGVINTCVNGRSMEFGVDLRTQIYIHAANTARTMKGMDGDSMEMTPTYGYVGTATMELDMCSDGMNTAGLSTGSLWLPGSEYQEPDHAHPERNVLCGFFVNWILGNCATTDDVQRALENGDIRVTGDQYIAKLAPLHFPVHDARGKSIVIEFLGGQPVITPNPVAVLTNRPFFPWQLDNLRNYVSLTPMDTPSIVLGSETFESTGHGTGLAGIPGNFTPPSRFVRTTYLKQFALPPKTPAEAQALAFHLLNSVDIPLGAVCSKSGPSILHPLGHTEYDYTQWIVVKDLLQRTLDIRMYNSPLTWRIDLNTLDFKKLDGKHISVPEDQIAMPLPLPN